MLYSARQDISGRLLPRRKEVTLMDFIFDLLDVIFSVGSFIFALINHFNGKK